MGTLKGLVFTYLLYGQLLLQADLNVEMQAQRRGHNLVENLYLFAEIMIIIVCGQVF